MQVQDVPETEAVSLPEVDFAERKRGLVGGEEIILDVRDLKNHFLVVKGYLQREFQAVQRGIFPTGER